MGWGNENEYKWFMLHDQDGHQVHIWLEPLKIFSGIKRPMVLKLGMRHWLLEYMFKQ